MHEHPGGIGAELGAQAASAPFPLAGVVIGGGLLLFLVAYAALVRAGRRRGRAWSDARTLSAAAGVVAGVVAVGPLGVLGHHDFTAHMWGHLLLGMLAPLLLVLSALGEDNVELVRQEQIPMRPELLDLFEMDELKKYYTGEELGGHRADKGEKA